MSLALSLIALTGLSPALAQPLEDRDDEIIVTGTRLPAPIAQIGRAVSVVTAEEIEIRQQRFLADALRQSAGVQIVRSGSVGSVTSVSIRGLPSSQTLVVQDGVVLNDPASFSNAFNFANFSAVDIERIEVLRGAQSTLYGSDAIGGVINIVTKDGANGTGADAFLEGGSFGTFRGAASLFGGGERASARLTINGTSTDGFSAADEANGNQEADGFDNLTISSKAQFAPLPSLRLETVARYGDSRAEFDAFGFDGPVDGDEVAKSEELTLAGRVTHESFDGDFQNRFQVGYSRTEQQFLTDGATSFDAAGDRLSYEYQATAQPFDWARLAAGAEYDIQESAVAVGFGGDQRIKTTSGFGLVQLTPLAFLTIDAGLRHDASDAFDNQTTFSASGVARLPTQTRLRGSYSEGFRAPSAGELGFNAQLFPEFSTGFDIGLEQPFWRSRGLFSVTYFDQRIDDLIAFDLAAFTFVNIQSFTSEGVEAALDLAPASWIDVSARYAYVDAVNLSTTIAAGNQPNHRGSLEIALRPTPRLSLSAGVIFNGEERAGAATLDEYALVHLRGRYHLSDALELFARIENATDTDYQDNAGYGTAPLSAYGGVRARF